MSALVYVVFGLLCAIAVLLLACLRVASLADERQARMPLPTARQRRRWKRDRLDLNPAMRRRK